MDKTTTWLVRAASLIVILFGIGYVSKPVGNKINDLSSTFKDFRSKPNLKGITCALTKEELKTDDHFFNKKTVNWYWLFDKKNGESYRYDFKTNYVYNSLNYILLMNKESQILKDIPIGVSYTNNSNLYIDLAIYSENEEEVSREPHVKINLKTLDWYDYANNSYSLLGTCRYIKVPKNIKLIEAEKFFDKEFSSY